MKKSVLIILCFILFTIIGTLSHELGHIVPAKILGYQTTLHYGSMEWEGEFLQYSNALYKKYESTDKIQRGIRTFKQTKIEPKKMTTFGS